MTRSIKPPEKYAITTRQEIEKFLDRSVRGSGSVTEDEAARVIESTGIAIKTSIERLARHLSAIKDMAFWHGSPANRQSFLFKISKLNRDAFKATAAFHVRLLKIAPLIRTMSEPGTSIWHGITMTDHREWMNTLPPDALPSDRWEEGAFPGPDPLWAKRKKSTLERLARFVEDFEWLTALSAQSAALKPEESWNATDANTFFIGVMLPLSYELNFVRRPGVAKDQADGSKVGGPMIRFLSAATTTVGILSDEGKPFAASTLEDYFDKARRHTSI